MPRPRYALAAALLLAVALAFAACDSDSNGSDDTNDSGTPVAAGTPGETPATSAVTAVVSAVTATGATGADVPIDVNANVTGDPGLGAWTLEIAFDPAVLEVKDCAEHSGTVCNPNKDEKTVRIAGAAADGLQGDVPLITITFTCKAAGASPLRISIELIADATIGAPQLIEPSAQDGTVTCT